MQKEENQDVNLFSVKQLKALLEEMGVDYSDCIEKGDLIKRYLDKKDHHIGQKQKESNQESFRSIADLECVILKNCEKPDLVCIICHGFGANHWDLVPISRSIIKLQKCPKVWFIHPNGPLSLGGESRAWWPIDMQDLMMKIMSGNYESVFVKPPSGLAEARAKLLNLLFSLQKETDLPLSRFFLGGFSQGSMLATDVCFHLDQNAGGLFIWSGVLLAKDLWASLVTKRKGLKVLQSHGRADPLLPFQLGFMLKEFLENNSLQVQFVTFDGGHTIDPSAVGAFASFLQDSR